MPLFNYRIVTDKGAVLEKEADAAEEKSLRRELEEKGYFVLKIQPSASSASGGGGAVKDLGDAYRSFGEILSSAKSKDLFHRKRDKRQGLNSI